MLSTCQANNWSTSRAQRIQKAFLPDPVCCQQSTLAYLAEAMDGVSGDLLDLFPVETDKTAIVIGDGLGHGVGPALVNIYLQQFLRIGIPRPTLLDPTATIAALRSAYLEKDFGDEHFMTLLFAVFDRTSRLLRYASAGHPHPVVVDQQRSVPMDHHCSGAIFCPALSQLVGWPTCEIRLSPGARVLFFTDGVTETRNETGDCFGRQRLERLLLASDGMSPDNWVSEAARCIRAHRATSPMADDQTLLLLSV